MIVYYNKLVKWALLVIDNWTANNNQLVITLKNLTKVQDSFKDHKSPHLNNNRVLNIYGLGRICSCSRYLFGGHLPLSLRRGSKVRSQIVIFFYFSHSTMGGLYLVIVLFLVLPDPACKCDYFISLPCSYSKQLPLFLSPRVRASHNKIIIGKVGPSGLSFTG